MAMTIRKLIELVGEEFMDAELSIAVVDGNNNREDVEFPEETWKLPRVTAIKQTGEPARMRIKVYLEEKRLVSVKK